MVDEKALSRVTCIRCAGVAHLRPKKIPIEIIRVELDANIGLRTHRRHPCSSIRPCYVRNVDSFPAADNRNHVIGNSREGTLGISVSIAVNKRSAF